MNGCWMWWRSSSKFRARSEPEPALDHAQKARPGCKPRQCVAQCGLYNPKCEKYSSRRRKSSIQDQKYINTDVGYLQRRPVLRKNQEQQETFEWMLYLGQLSAERRTQWGMEPRI